MTKPERPKLIVNVRMSPLIAENNRLPFTAGACQDDLRVYHIRVKAVVCLQIQDGSCLSAKQKHWHLPRSCMFDLLVDPPWSCYLRTHQCINSQKCLGGARVSCPTSCKATEKAWVFLLIVQIWPQEKLKQRRRPLGHAACTTQQNSYDAIHQ